MTKDEIKVVKAYQTNAAKLIKALDKVQGLDEKARGGKVGGKARESLAAARAPIAAAEEGVTKLLAEKPTKAAA